jgi:hypothetical protein
MKIPIIGNLTKGKSIALGCVLAFIMVMVFVPFGGGNENTETFEWSNDGSEVSGEVTSFAELLTELGNIIWSTESDDGAQAQSIVDPTSGEAVSTCVLGVSWEAWGENIEWSTMQVTGTFFIYSYAGNGGGIEYDEMFEEITVLYTAMDDVDGRITGELECTPIDIDSHIPDTVILTYSTPEDPDILDGLTLIEQQSFPQKGSESHPIELVYKAQYWVVVTDDYGDTYDEVFTQYTTLSLQWEGSSFDIDWGGEESVDMPTGTIPVINSVADYSCAEYVTFNIMWNPRDPDGNPDRYEITVDDEVAASGAWYGLDIPFSNVYRPGIHVVTCTVYDSDGNSASDSVNIITYSEIEDVDIIIGGDPIDDGDAIISVYPEDPTDATAYIDIGEPDYDDRAIREELEDAVAMSGLSDFAGSQEGLLILAAIAGAAIIGYKTGVFNSIGKSLRRAKFKS